MDIDRARAVADVAQVIINSAKVEVEHLKVAGGKGSGFINGNPADVPAGVVSITRHHLGG
jgi:sporulation protein YlmC with PRC-barrel domain